MDPRNKSNRTTYVRPKAIDVSDGFWADHVNKVDSITKKWREKYGYLYEKNLPFMKSVSESRERQMPVQASPGHTQGVGAGLEAKAPKTPYGYPVPAHTAKPRVAKDHVLPYSSSLGHHSVQFGDQNQVCVKKPTSTNDFYLQVRSSRSRDGALQTKQPGELKPRSSLLDGCGLVNVCGILYNLDDPADRDKLAMEQVGCSWDALQRHLRGIPPIEICPKCENHLCCTCVPRRREKVPEDPDNGPDRELPSWPPQVWSGPSYRGSRVGTLGDIIRLRDRLSKDPETQTPMNRMWDEMKAHEFAGDRARYAHTADKSYNCGMCRTAREEARGTWFDEQLKKGNPFTTGDTQFKSCAYMRKS